MRLVTIGDRAAGQAASGTLRCSPCMTAVVVSVLGEKTNA
jgi:hypothetical protein